jgi:hypothetical protein
MTESLHLSARPKKASSTAFADYSPGDAELLGIEGPISLHHSHLSRYTAISPLLVSQQSELCLSQKKALK